MEKEICIPRGKYRGRQCDIRVPIRCWLRCVVAKITAFARDLRLHGAQLLVRNRVRSIRLMYKQNDYTHKMAAAGKKLKTYINM